MDKANDHQKHRYSWHQSHDQATVLLLVPYDISEEDIVVVIERNYLLAGVKDQQPIIKGTLYGNVDTTNSAWQLEPRTRLSTRERTTSTISTVSTQSSYAFVSDPEISSSFAASLESAQASDSEEPITSSPALSSPVSSSADERAVLSGNQRQQTASSDPVSPRLPTHALSSFSSLESLHSHSGRLLTLHLEKDQPVIWPSLIVGPVPYELSICAPMPSFLNEPDSGHKYNMDPTSLALIAIELLDIRQEKEQAFGYFVRAWHQAHLPSTTMKLVMHYLPLHTSPENYDAEKAEEQGSVSYYIRCIGGANGLGQLFMEAGLLHLEGAASIVLSASYSVFSSLRIPPQPTNDSGTQAWKRDREIAVRYFDRARTLNPGLDVPVLPVEAETALSSMHELEMPSVELYPSSPGSVQSCEESHYSETGVTIRRRRQKKDELVFMDDMKAKDDIDSAWYLYVPSLVGAGTALLLVGVVGALSFSSWRRNQGS